MRRICVFCGSSLGEDPAYVEMARALGGLLAYEKIGLVYGGASVGLMGVVADTILIEGGEAIGVIPKFMEEKELAHQKLTQLHIVNSMHERKALMAELSDGFIALPGGVGTFEEFFETLTWAQLSLHTKPCGLLNVSNYYDKLIDFIDYAVTQGFIKAEHRSLVLVDDTPQKLLKKFTEFIAGHQDRGVAVDKV